MFNHQQSFAARFRGAVVLILSGVATVVLGGATQSSWAGNAECAVGADWPMFGQNWANTANGAAPAINPLTVKRLAVKWTFTTQADVSARAAIVGDAAYFPDFSG